jgi:COP9 signalosome complex subunit 1
MQVDAQPEDNENNEEEVFMMVEEPTLDLENYAASYSGLAKLNRLLFIADHCPSLKLEAIKMAINYVMATTYNVTMYQLLHKKLADMAIAGPLQALPDVASQSASNQDVPPYDAMWVEQKTKKAALKLEKLDNDLKNSKSNSIKESIRR